MALRHRPEIRQRQSRADAHGNRAGTMTRRELILWLALAAAPERLWREGGQGVSSRGVRPQPRGKPSGRPFQARFTDVAKEAGLTQPVIYGPADHKNYIIEVVGCGVA